MKKLLVIPLVVLSLLSNGSEALSSIRTEWRYRDYSPGSVILTSYRIKDYYNNILYVETRTHINGKVTGNPYNWRIDCKNKRMVGDWVSYTYRDGYWQGTKDGKPTSSGIPRKFDYYCSYVG